MPVQKVTSVMVVPSVSRELALWQELGFQVVAEVPHGDSTGFAILSSAQAEIMLQTLASLKEDLPAVASLLGDRRSYLFCDVSNLDEVRRQIGAAKVIVPERKTFYGTREFFIQSTSGEIIGFAEKV